LEKVILIFFVGLLMIGVTILIPVISVSVILSPSSAIDSSSFNINTVSTDDIINNIIDDKIKEIMEDNLEYNKTTGEFIRKGQDKVIQKSNNLIAEFNENEFYRVKIVEILDRIEDKLEDIKDSWEDAIFNPGYWAAKYAKWKGYERIYENKEDDREDNLKELRNKIKLLTVNGKTYKAHFVDKDQIYKYELVGQDNLPKLKDDLNKKIDKKLINTIVTYCRPDGLIKNREVTIDDYNYKINSASLVKEIVNEYIGTNSFLKYNFNSLTDKEKIAYNSRDVEVFINVIGHLETIILAGEEKGGKDVTKTFKIEKIPYYRKIRRFNIFIRDNDALIENLLEKDDSILNKVRKAKELTKDEVREELSLRMKEVSIINNGSSKYTNYSHFEKIRNVNLSNRKNKNRKELITKAESIKEKEYIYFPNKSELDYKRDLKLEIPKEYEKIPKKIPNELKTVFPKYYKITTQEDDILNKTNELKKDHTYDNKPLIEIKEYGWFDSGKLSKAGIGYNGFVQLLFDNKYQNMKELYQNSTYLRERELEQGDIAFYTNPETSTNNLLGIYLGYEDLNFIIGLFKNANKHFLYFPIFLKDYPDNEFKRTIHAKEIKAARKEVKTSRELYMYMKYYPTKRGD